MVLMNLFQLSILYENHLNSGVSEIWREADRGGVVQLGEEYGDIYYVQNT